MYREVLKSDLSWIDNINWSKRLSAVYTVDEAMKLLVLLDGQHGLIAGLLYGAGLGQMECVRLRIQDIDFGYHQIAVRDGKGQKDRVSILPKQLYDRPRELVLKN